MWIPLQLRYVVCDAMAEMFNFIYTNMYVCTQMSKGSLVFSSSCKFGFCTDCRKSFLYKTSNFPVLNVIGTQ